MLARSVFVSLTFSPFLGMAVACAAAGSAVPTASATPAAAGPDAPAGADVMNVVPRPRPSTLTTTKIVEPLPPKQRTILTHRRILKVSPPPGGPAPQ
jgi:hypothetical protein